MRSPALRESEAALAILEQLQDLYDVRVQAQLWLSHSAALLLGGDRAGAREWAGKALAAGRRYDDPASRANAAAQAALNVAAP